MKILRRIAAAFMLYSIVPMPKNSASGEDMEGAITFLPLVGIVIALVMYLLVWLLFVGDIPVFIRAITVILVPLVITGRFHLDGFMDTVDAIRSYQPRERKLAIMKDPHTGSFAVTGLVMTVLFIISGVGVILNIPAFDPGLMINICGIFVISRAMTAVTSLWIKKAKQDGMLVNETLGAGRIQTAVVFTQMAVVLFIMICVRWQAALPIIAAFAVFTGWYRHMVTKEFGGVTGDTAGYFVTVSETVAVCALAVCELAIRSL